jgi:plasmid replication initiation protein
VQVKNRNSAGLKEAQMSAFFRCGKLNKSRKLTKTVFYDIMIWQRTKKQQRGHTTMKEEVRLARVRKANELIQKSRFSLSLQQQKIILYLISKIQPTDTEFHEYKFEIKSFCEACGIEYDSGALYSEIKEAVKNISDKSLWVKMPDGRETLLRWIEKASIEAGTGILTIRLDNDMKPYLLQLNKNYTTYDLIYTLTFKSKYSVRLYELIKSIHYDESEPYSKTYSVDELKKLLSAETYKTYSHFKQFALDPAINEINAISDKTVSYEVAEKSGKKITHLTLHIAKYDTLKNIINQKFIAEGKAKELKSRSKKKTSKLY